VFKDLAEIFYKMLTTLAAMVALKCTHVGEKFFTQHYTIYSASVYIIMAFFMTWMLQTLLQHPIPNDSISVFPISLLLLLGYAVSFLALILISLNIAVINDSLFSHLLSSSISMDQNSEKIKQIFEKISPQLKGRVLV